MHIGLIHMDGDDLSRAGEEPSGGLRIAVINPLPAHFHLGTFLNTSEQPWMDCQAGTPAARNEDDESVDLNCD